MPRDRSRFTVCRFGWPVGGWQQAALGVRTDGTYGAQWTYERPALPP